MADFEERQRETEAYLAKIRRTIAESNALIDQAELRIRETDRLIESQGLTREQVLAMRFTDEQLEAANRELARRGMEPLEGEDFSGGSRSSATADALERVPPVLPSDGGIDDRRKKFSAMMKPFRI